MNIWNYLFYISILILTFLFFLKKISFKKNKLLLLSGLTFFTIAITLSFPANVHWWYLMPVFPFAAILLVYGISELQIINSYYKYLFLLLALFLGIRQFIFINNPDDSLKKLFVQNELKIRQAAKIIYKNPKQDVLLYAEWNSDGRNIVQDFFPGDSSHKVCIIYDSSQQYFFGNGFYTAGCFKNTCIKFNF